jgi:hypothetical protein
MAIAVPRIQILSSLIAYRIEAVEFGIGNQWRKTDSIIALVRMPVIWPQYCPLLLFARFGISQPSNPGQGTDTGDSRVWNVPGQHKQKG